ncbi:MULTISPECIES: chorismate-binding protein [Chryseobacterium]|uniref:Isochorismate synthase n=1 Tax=Chryseobacterium camelliae TaxID=1265445 RepID=A0ABU0TJ08_9FLAO|nr:MULTISPECIES: chorismate-binding protein [Chryseobacterium]MDT3409103.1 isochorismate synthase [Pseudacidovorax intermedius]MDQ1097039.1 isochorismate synthase [Chryseobacterium camelliae]MDQ1100977.1 isochorismate synthase [Chryseobacterium sp. SORGH_AS_1048]MDR6084419.1 isochorismate synthase [Chryseobacterium sp. SORGH_AS_0909]MDR6132690.1 isochorismate synthase [Chryseobacterium sp. SORGH_AS_1175]
MVYFKFPFDEKLYSADESFEKKNISFNTFDGLSQIDFTGSIVEISTGEFADTVISSKFLPEDKSGYISETKPEYLNQLEQVIEVIKENHLPKLVYSRRKIFADFREIDLKKSFENLCKSYPNAFRYIFIHGEHSWMGAFSEVLGKFNQSTHEFETMSLAGTLPVSEQWTEKEIEEQKPVSDYIKAILDHYSSEVITSDTYDHISGNIKHLRTDFRAKIRPQDLDLLIADLHPTPAVCGIPKAFCKEQIERIEKYPRELYSGYIRIENDETVQYYVNLRCAKLFKDSVHMFVGGGITSQSSPEKEWRETELKSEAILKNLVLV